MAATLPPDGAIITMPQRSPGYTLIELMIVLALTAVLATWAMPAYQNYRLKVERAEARSFMLILENQEETYFMDQGRYATLSGLNISIPASVAKNHTISVSVDNSTIPPAYTITADPTPDLAALGEPTLELSSSGARKPPELWSGR